MGQSISFGQLQVKLTKAAESLERSTPGTVKLAAQSAAKEIEDQIRGRVPDLDMSGLSSQRTRSGKQKSGKIGTKLLSRTKVGGNTMAVRAAGPVHWLESGTRAHLTGVGRLTASGQARVTKKGKYRKGQQRRMNYPGGDEWRTGPFRHPGMKAGHTWSKGVRKAIPEAAKVFRQRSVADAFEPFV